MFSRQGIRKSRFFRKPAFACIFLHGSLICVGGFFNRGRVFVKSEIFSFLAVIALGLGTAVSVKAQTAQEVERVKQEALNRDAEFISRHSGLPYEDVQRQLRLQISRGNLVANLEEEFKDRLAGIYAEHYPVDRIVVRLVENIPVESRKLQFDSDSLVVDFIVAQAYTKAELRDVVEKNSAKLKRYFHGLQGIGVDERTGEVVLDISASERETENMKEMHTIAQNILKIPVRINMLSPGRAQRHASIIGGGSLPAIKCTSAFAVRHALTNIKGVVTADHCWPGDTPYIGYGSNNFPIFLLEMSGVNTPSADARWYKPFPWGFYSNNIDPSVYGLSTDALIPVTGSKTQAATAVGDRVCHRGVTTGYSCGNVDDKIYKPVWNCGPSSNPITCSDTWVKIIPPGIVMTPGLACAGGDSGGPVLIGTLAVGIFIGGKSYSNSIGGCDYAVYMSTDRINNLGLELIYWP